MKSPLFILGSRGPASVNQFGQKAMSLHRMIQAKLPVPPGFALSANTALTSGRQLASWVARGLGHLPDDALFSVRCSPVVPMLGLAGTVLNLRRDGVADAVCTALASWHSPRAVAYRRRAGIDDETGLSIIVQAMVHGNADGRSGSGTGFTRDPVTGERRLCIEFFPGAEGKPVSAALPNREALPASAYRRLLVLSRQLEHLFEDVQDFEFTVEAGRVYLLQSRPARRSAGAAVKIAVDLAREKIIGEELAVCRVDPAQLEQILHATFDPSVRAAPVAQGLAGSPGAAFGQIAFSAEEAQARAGAGQAIILVRPETDASDVVAMHRCAGILTSTGGMTSHAAVECRAMGKPCIVGASEVRVDAQSHRLTAGAAVLRSGDWLSIDGSTGEVFAGRLPTIPPAIGPALKTLLKWADRHRRLKVLANADTPADAKLARQFGAEGVGLCRTEHMFFHPDRVTAMREMILADDAETRRRALARLLAYQRRDFVGLFKAMAGLPVTIRLLDPPLHEFLPHSVTDQRRLARATGRPLEEIQRRVEQLRETNPMLGHRGCRVAITCPEILAMQVQAISQAAADCARDGIRSRPEIMVPFVVDAAELRYLRQLVAAAATGAPRIIGTMVETPRAALRAHDIAQQADFISFGTNDLTQMTFGISRDDVSRFLSVYLARRILDGDPFEMLDIEGVGQLVRFALHQARRARPAIKAGLCGEHGGQPAAIAFCDAIALEYVSCSPYRVPIARLAAAQAAILAGKRRCT